MNSFNPKITPVLISLATLFTLIGVIGLIGYYQLKPETTMIAEITPPQPVSLTFTLPTTPLFQNNELALPLIANSGSSPLTAVDAELVFDPTFVQILAVTPSPTLTTVLRPAQFTSSPLSFAYGITPNQDPLTGETLIATLHLKLLKNGNTSLAFNQNTLATVKDQDTNALTPPPPTQLTILGPMLPGDLNKDGQVDLLDFNAVIVHYGTTYNLLDFNAVIVNYGQAS